jgi:hypothetical protein
MATTMVEQKTVDAQKTSENLKLEITRVIRAAGSGSSMRGRGLSSYGSGLHRGTWLFTTRRPIHA